MKCPVAPESVWLTATGVNDDGMFCWEPNLNVLASGQVEPDGGLLKAMMSEPRNELVPNEFTPMFQKNWLSPSFG